VFKHKTTDLLAMSPMALDSGGAGSNQVPHRFVTLVRHPHSRQLAGAQEPCETNGISSIRLYSIARLFGDK
jgi:hypothetical protein